MTTSGPTGVTPPAIEVRSITKRFGPVLACDRIDLSARRGEIHGVLGQNGAGKTTLMNILLGLVAPDAGEILVDGTAVAIHDPIEAARLGLAMVHQHFSLIGPLTVWENVTLGEQGRVDAGRTIRRVHETAERYGLAIDARARVDDLTTGQRQRVEIVKCLMRDPRVFILDEPTSVLTAAESLELFGVLRTVVREENRAVILISHKLDEILHATDRVTIMRNGEVVGRVETARTDADELAREMMQRCGVQLYMLRPDTLLSLADALAVSVRPGSVEDVERTTRVEDAAAEGDDATAGWTYEALEQLLARLSLEAPVQEATIRLACQQGGFISRDDVYRLGEYDPERQLKGFTRPVNRLVQQLRDAGDVPQDAADVLVPVYDEMKHGFGWADGFRVPSDLVALLPG